MSTLSDTSEDTPTYQGHQPSVRGNGSDPLEEVSPPHSTGELLVGRLESALVGLDRTASRLRQSTDTLGIQNTQYAARLHAGGTGWTEARLWCLAALALLAFAVIIPYWREADRGQLKSDLEFCRGINEGLIERQHSLYEHIYTQARSGLQDSEQWEGYNPGIVRTPRHAVKTETAIGETHKLGCDEIVYGGNTEGGGNGAAMCRPGVAMEEQHESDMSWSGPLYTITLFLHRHFH